MLAKWLEKYKKLSEKIGIISKLSSFLLSVFLVLSFYDFARFFYFNPKQLDNGFIEDHQFLITTIFQIAVLFIFTSRFILLFLKTRKAFWLSQILSLAGLFVLFIYWCYSRPLPSEMNFGLYHAPLEYFKNSSDIFQLYSIYYLILSPIKKLVIAAIALVKSR